MINWNKLYMYSTYSKRSTNAVLLQLVQPAQRTLDWNDLFLPRTRPTLYLRSPTFLPAWQEFLPLTTCWFGLHSPPLHMHSSHVFISKLKHRWVKFKTKYEECFQCGSNSKLKLLGHVFTPFKLANISEHKCDTKHTQVNIKINLMVYDWVNSNAAMATD